MSLFRNIIALALMIVAVGVVIYFALPSRMAQSKQATAFQILESEWLKFFATNRIVTQVAIQSSNTDLLLGDEYSVAFGVAEIVYGIDFGKMTTSDILQTERQLLITLPEPEVFSVSIRQDSITVMTKSTLLRKLGSMFVGEDVSSLLRVALEEEAISFASTNGLFPSEAEVYKYIQGFFQQLFPGTEVVITNIDPSKTLTQ